MFLAEISKHHLRFRDVSEGTVPELLLRAISIIAETFIFTSHLQRLLSMFE